MSAQLELVPREAAGAVPIRQALQLVADQWTRRLGRPIRVVELSNGGGYRLEPQ